MHFRFNRKEKLFFSGSFYTVTIYNLQHFRWEKRLQIKFSYGMRCQVLSSRDFSLCTLAKSWQSKYLVVSTGTQSRWQWEFQFSICLLSFLCHARIVPTSFVPEGAFQPMFTFRRHCCLETRRKVKRSHVSECNGKFNEQRWLMAYRAFNTLQRTLSAIFRLCRSYARAKHGTFVES